VFTSDGLESHIGNYSDWRAYRRQQAEAAKPTATAAPSPRLPQSSTEVIRNAKKDRERQQRRRERLVASLEEEIARVETELQALRAQLALDHGGDWKKLHQLADQERELDALLAKRMTDWEKASADLQAFLSGGD
jgi:ATP-binding cassette subfamily F protein 3